MTTQSSKQNAYTTAIYARLIDDNEVYDTLEFSLDGKDKESIMNQILEIEQLVEGVDIDLLSIDGATLAIL